MQHHIIQQQMFDVGFSNAETSYELQNKISEVFHNQLSDAMEQLFTRLVPDDLVLSMGDVEIDIGNVAYNQLEYVLADRVLIELEKEIKGRLALIPSPNGDEQTKSDLKTLSGSYVGLLEYFLLTGTLPWWASGELLSDPLKVMQYLMANDTGRLKQLIVNVGQHGYVRQRLVNQFAEEVIKGIILILEPAQANFIFDYHATVSKTHLEEKLVESAPATEFEKALWLFILTYILIDRGSLFNRKMFVGLTLGQIARHYNRTYSNILALLAKALEKYNLADRQNNELLLIINDLSVDQFDDQNSVQRGRDTNNKQYTNEEAVLQDLEIIKYYLVFGSLPWWCEPYGENNLTQLLLDLIQAIPKTLRKVIVTAGQSDEVRKRIVTVFSEEVIIGIVKILEPADAPFIINYVNEVQDIHVKKPVVYTDAKDFKRAVWKFVFDFLLVERGSDFNRRMFLQSNIRKLADNYNVQYFEMLMYLVQSIGQVHQDNIDQAPLFKLLAILLNDNEEYKATEFRPRNFEERGAPDKKQHAVLKDVLLYWLTYGSIPWWGRSYFELGPANMFLSLLAQAPADAFLLLKYSGTMPHIRTRVIYQFPPGLVMDAFAQQASALQAVKHYRYLLLVFNDVAKVLQINIASAETALLAIFWDVYMAGEYKSFNDRVFLQKAITYLLNKAGTGHRAQTISALRTAFTAEGAIGKTGKRIGGGAASKTVTGDQKIYLLSLDEVVGQAGEEDVWIEDIFALDEQTIEAGDINEVITAYLSKKEPTEQEIAAEVLRVLQHFVSAKKLPELFKNSNPAYVTAVIKQLLQFLKKTTPAAYKQLIANAEVLRPYLGKHAASGAQVEGSIEQLISTYLHRKKQERTDILTDDILNEALTLLQYFLTNGKLPDAFVPAAGIDTATVLKQLILVLQYARPNALNDILQRDGYRAEAKIRLHNLFALTFNTAENNVSRVLRTYIENDIVQYIRSLGTAFNADDKLKVLIDQHLNIDKTSDHKLISNVLKQPSVARYVARYYTNKQVQDMLANNTTAIGGTENLSWLAELQTLIEYQVTDTLLRDQLNNLIREFNLMILGGHIGTANFVVYIKELLGFIASQNKTLLTALTTVLTQAAAANSKTSVAFREKLSVGLVELDIQKVRVKNEQSVKKQLDNATDEALQNIADLNAAKQKAAEAKQVKEELKRTEKDREEEARDTDKKLLVHPDDAIYINNAGLVLLNPFIPAFFVRTGVVHGGKFVSNEAQLRAVHLLQYLVDGSNNRPEHMLVLNKILCNLPVDEPVPAAITLTDAEKQIAEDLLKAVLNNWDKLKNTSIEGLRGSFLIRDGSLIFKEDAWHLKIEQRGYDVLLQFLPWSIAMIKAQWMDKFLYVEWI